MIFGFNSNVRVGEATYHVQTEDRGPAHPFVDTVVYLSGRVVYKRSTSYEKIARGAVEKNLTQWLRDRISQQHREVIAELEAGKLALHGQEKRREPAAAPPPTNPGAGTDAPERLDLRLKNPKTWLAAGTATLELGLFEKSSQHSVADAEVEVCLEHDRIRIPCADGITDSAGSATLRFSMPLDVAPGSFLVVRATDEGRFGELRFRLKAKVADKSPAPVA